MATFSAFRLIKLAKDEDKLVGLINVGQSRGDDVVDWRVGWKGGSSDVLPSVVERLLELEGTEGAGGGGRRQVDEALRTEVREMLKKGKVKKVGAGSGAA